MLGEDEEIYMQPPPGYEGQEDTVKRLRKSFLRAQASGAKMVRHTLPYTH